LISPKISGIPWNYPPTQQQSQPGISSIFSGESPTKPSFVTGILGVFVTWSALPGDVVPKVSTDTKAPRGPLAEEISGVVLQKV